MDRRHLAGTGITVSYPFPDDCTVDAGKMPAVHKCLTIFGALEKSNGMRKVENDYG